MRQSTSLFRFTLWFLRYDSWANRKRAQFAHLLANMIYRLARRLPNTVQPRVTAIGNLLEQFTQTSVQLQSKNMNPAGLFLGLFYGGLIGYWAASTPTLSALIGLPAWFIALLLISTFALLMLFLLVSGDIYFEKQDEAQKALSHEAATLTTSVTIVLLLLFSIVDKSGPIWQHSSIYQALTLTLVLVMRIVYMAKLASLRWSELAVMEGELDTIQ